MFLEQMLEVDLGHMILFMSSQQISLPYLQSNLLKNVNLYIAERSVSSMTWTEVILRNSLCKCIVYLVNFTVQKLLKASAMLTESENIHNSFIISTFLHQESQVQ